MINLMKIKILNNKKEFQSDLGNLNWLKMNKLKNNWVIKQKMKNLKVVLKIIKLKI